ncbi:MAG: hypothetical protein GEU95_10535 [Rhizobiales bacterium]|nr:hypothetical protein [Hyphomicrobiales bacterium]
MVYMDDEELAKFKQFPTDIQVLSLLSVPLSNARRNAVSRACNQLWRDDQITAYDLKGFTAWAIPPRHGEPRPAL